MKLPQNLAHEAARDRAASGRRLVHQRATVGFPATPVRVSPARACLDEAIARHELREARRRAGATVPTFTAKPARFRAASSPQRVKEALDRTRKEMETADGLPAELRDATTKEEWCRKYVLLNRVGLGEALLAFGRHFNVPLGGAK
jgi:hypothetical protein